MMRRLAKSLLERKAKTRIEELNEQYVEVMKRGTNASTAQARAVRSTGLDDQDVLSGKQHILHKQRKDRLVFLPDREILENSNYPAEYPSTYVPVPEPEVPNHKGRRALGQLYKQFLELYNRHRRFVWFNGYDPSIQAGGVWVAPSATVIGDVRLCDHVNVWYNAVLRGDKNSIEIGGYTNIQDGVVITTDDKPNFGGFDSNVVIGGHTTIGHGVKLHACRIGNECVIGMNATILEGAVIEDNVVIAAGSLVPPGRRIPHGEMWAGSPAKFVRKLGHHEEEQVKTDAEAYVNLAEAHSLEFTSFGKAYKEVDVIADKLEQINPESVDGRPVHWQVWHEQSKNATVALWKKDRIL
ncbi:predicted protein [Naegleria gruberi]|uniref:Predicted protein n=1 Tax=Naegleria gruberi TaxID=5762 RepID=D2VY95_NAEGR|nr:uncharacterized protein NAEGRDRAFT_81690 [Naegleria gruberi]EFC38210.1 predicted protein [Naegleria gruberi]|eukprot:XP_002670954.1 predicted protein [Naegleria gruberi strain NEG-M]